MIIQLLAALLALIGLFLLLRSLWLRSGLTPRQTWLTAGAALTVAALIGLAATGRLHWVFAAGAALLPFVRRAAGLLRFVPLVNHLFPGWHQRFRTPAGGPNSGTDYATTETDHLRMSLHQASGHIDGEILTGPRTGCLLSELELSEILDLYGSLPDPDSKRLLETYLDRTWPAWRTAGSGPDPDAGSAQATGEVDRKKALDVLGLDEEATDQDVIDAHRRLMQKLHPDRGGSTYLAATLNEAKRILLER